MSPEHAEKTLIQQTVHKTSDLAGDHLAEFFHALALADSEHLALLADDKNVGGKRFDEHGADVIEHNLRCARVMQQLIDLSCLVQQLYAHVHSFLTESV